MGAPATRWMRLAGVLAGVWGAFMLLASVAVTIPLLAQHGNLLPMGVPVLLAIVSVVGGWGVARARAPFHHLALGASASWVAFLFMVPLKVSVVGIALNILVAGIVATTWRRFR